MGQICALIAGRGVYESGPLQLIWARNFSENTIKISSITLRRFIVIRNWLPHDEQQFLDELIQQVRRKCIMPAPYPASKVTKLVSSIVDGAGVQCIMFETKTKNQRTIAGFLLKEGIGIREPFVMHKAHPEEFTNILDQHELPSKSVSTVFVSKLVSHFITISDYQRGSLSNGRHIPPA